MTRPVAWLAAALVLATSACATVGAQLARNRELEKKLKVYRIDKPLDEVWQAARVVLVQAGYQLVGADAAAVGQGNLNAAERFFSPAHETTSGTGNAGILGHIGVLKDTSAEPNDRRYLDTEWNQYFERYHLDGMSDGDGCRIAFTHIKGELGYDEKANRDYELELDVIRRVDPDAAAKIEADLPETGD